MNFKMRKIFLYKFILFSAFIFTNVFVFKSMKLLVFELVAIVIYGFFYSKKAKRTVIKLKSKKIRGKYKAIFFADYHSNPADGINDIIKSESEDADFIFLGGDIVDDKAENFKVDELFSTIGESKTFYVLGNHEVRRKDLSDLINYFKNNSTYLTRKTSPISISNFDIYGIDDVTVNENDFNYSLLYFKEHLDMKKFNILLVHRPEYFEKYLEAGFDLVLTGHAHAGHARLPFIGAIVAPGQGLFPRYQKGLYTKGEQNMFLTSGSSKKKYLVPRFFNKPEVVIINFMEEL